MKISNLAQAIGCKIINEKYEDSDIASGYTSDLLSDVMANAEEGSVLITIQAHKNTVAVAVQLDMPAIIICNNRQIQEDMIEAANLSGVAILSTSESQYVVSHKVHQVING